MTSGASPKGPDSIAEIRSSSIRGQFRWWFRALGGSSEDEARLFGSVAGERGHASAFILRIIQILDASSAPAKPLSLHQKFTPPRTARDIGCSDMNTSGYLAFNIRASGDARAMIPERTRFVVAILSPRLPLGDFHRLCQVFRMFAKFGSLGTRSRRTFGCLSLTDEKGALPAEPTSWNYFSNRRVDWRQLPGGPWPLARLRIEAGIWLKNHRNNRDVLQKRQRGEVFGHAGTDGPLGEKRRGSPVILRPVLASNGQFSLGVIVPRPTPKLLDEAIR